MSYNDIKKEIDRKIYNYIESHDEKGFLKNNISEYANEGFEHGKYTEIIAECFSVRTNNEIAKEILVVLGGGHI